MNDYTNVIKSVKLTSNSKKNRQKTQNTEGQKPSFPEERVKTVDLMKPN